MRLDSHERSPDAACIEGCHTRIDESIITHLTDQHLLLSEIGKVFRTCVNIPSLESACNLRIEKRIDRCASVLIEKLAVLVSQILHKVIYAAGTVERSCEIEDPLVQIGCILKIENSFETACHGLFHQSPAVKFDLGICITECSRDVKAFNRIDREIKLIIICI